MTRAENANEYYKRRQGLVQPIEDQRLGLLRVDTAVLTSSEIQALERASALLGAVTQRLRHYG